MRFRVIAVRSMHSFANPTILFLLGEERKNLTEQLFDNNNYLLRGEAF